MNATGVSNAELQTARETILDSTANSSHLPELRNNLGHLAMLKLAKDADWQLDLLIRGGEI